MRSELLFCHQSNVGKKSWSFVVVDLEIPFVLLCLRLDVQCLCLSSELVFSLLSCDCTVHALSS